MKYPYGLQVARKHFKKLGWHRKQMVAVVISGNQMFVGTNIMKSHPQSKSRENRIHAELSVIRHLTDDSNRAKLFIYRERFDGSSALARPCSSCITLLRENNIRKVYYSTDLGYAQEKIS